jgi:protein-S-isoprenylcysteine O-methyltransferase Ste14
MSTAATPANDRPPLRAIVGTIIFTVVVPGTVVVLVPYLLTGWRFDAPLLGVAATRWLGAAVIVLAAPFFFSFLVRFVTEGHGTPAPIAPPEHLVVGGPFRYVRNPAYVCVVKMVAGQALLFGSWATLAYSVFLAAGFHLFVVLYEEPALRAQFGVEYDAYCRSVPRWLPRLRPYSPA